MNTGPHTSTTTEDGVELLWEDISYQVKAGFVKILSEDQLLTRPDRHQLKISQVVVVPQTNRHDRIILNLSVQVKMPKLQSQPEQVHPAMNKTTMPVAD